MRDERDHLDVTLAEAVSLAQHRPTLPWPGDSAPSDEELLRYLDGGLPPLERERMRQALHRSAWCRERLTCLREALEEVSHDPDEAPVSTGKNVRLSFLWARGGLRFLWGSLTPRSLVAVPVATRGSVPDGVEESAFFDFGHRFEDVEVAIQVERVPGDRLDLQLQFQGDAPRIRQLRVSLSDQTGALLDSQPVERGVARFSALPAATHRISITAAQHELGSLVLDVHPS